MGCEHRWFIRRLLCLQGLDQDPDRQDVQGGRRQHVPDADRSVGFVHRGGTCALAHGGQGETPALGSVTNPMRDSPADATMDISAATSR